MISRQPFTGAPLMAHTETEARAKRCQWVHPTEGWTCLRAPAEHWLESDHTYTYTASTQEEGFDK